MNRIIAAVVLCSTPLATGAASAQALSAVDVAAGKHHTCAVLMNGRVRCWGYNAYGQLGYDDTNNRGDAPGEMSALHDVPIDPEGGIVQMALGNHHTCVRTIKGAVLCWGLNASGQLGRGNTENLGDEPSEVAGGPQPILREAAKISSGYAHTCALKVNGTVVCWGHNAFGQLGVGDTDDRRDERGEAFAIPDLGTGRRAVDIAAFGYSTCALLDTQVIKCWGNNSSGQLGLGDRLNRGNSPGEMGDSLPGVALTWATSVGIVGGGAHACQVARHSYELFKCWGNNSQGQLGLGDVENRGDEPGEMGTSLPPVQSFSHQLSLGTYHTCVVRGFAQNAVHCWGGNDFGQLGVGDVENRGDEPDDLGVHVNVGTLPNGGALFPVRVAAGAYHTCARLSNGAVKCWGYNGYGQLGLGDTANRGDGPGEMGDALPALVLGE